MAAEGDNAVTAADVSRVLDAFEEAIEELRLLYEKYFVGIERQAPASRHRDVKAELRRLERLHMRKTALRFRMSGLKARLVTYEYYWTRVLNQIERGTFRRDLQMRAQRRVPAPAPPAKQDAKQSEAEANDAAPMPSPPRVEPASDAPRPRVTEISAPRPTPPPPPGSPRPPPPPPVPVPGMKGTEVRRLFQDLVSAKKAIGEDTSGLTERALARKLSRELPKLREQHGGPVAFEVSTVKGKVLLRARPVAGAK
ncbi:MXAN_5187 C-terminal domain-containing protein [Paraliomyxa miuraensis]|uniref:MXAN_5187 C-terminal domain-containing protein n=1 Tax=Paraliomyxa miuraensis TaxID=376150 RepID=UPI0022552281|nr:MXAN_5187 C-terminal domain-containing protein [Paraliomyxa miuraensis]MCX4239344.1 hypothetical protein [Paraliomyxa miuraensis]